MLLNLLIRLQKIANRLPVFGGFLTLDFIRDFGRLSADAGEKASQYDNFSHFEKSPFSRGVRWREP